MASGRNPELLQYDDGGEGGIRTPDTLASMPHFECGAFNHSATSPCRGRARARNLATNPCLRKCGAAAQAWALNPVPIPKFLQCSGNQRGRCNISPVVPDRSGSGIGGDMAA